MEALIDFCPELMTPGEEDHERWLRTNYRILLEKSKIYYIRLIDDKKVLDSEFFKGMLDYVMEPVQLNDREGFWKRCFLFEYLMHKYKD